MHILFHVGSIYLPSPRQNIKTNLGRFAKLFIILGKLANKCVLIWLLPLRLSVFLLRPLWAHFQRFLLDGGHTLHSTGAWVWPGANLRIQDLCRPDRTFFGKSIPSYNWLENQFCIHRGFSCFWCWSAIDRFWAAFVEIDAGTGTQNFLTRSTRSISFPFPPLCQKFLNL